MPHLQPYQTQGKEGALRLWKSAPVLGVAIFLLSCFILLIGVSWGQEKPSAGQSQGRSTSREFVTRHKIEIDKVPIAYTAVAGETILENPEGAQDASIFSISYIREGVDNRENWPITFLFNGGPGSSAVWLHLGAFGPRRIALSSDPVNPGGPPYKLEDNPNTLLRFSDLVFVDPVGTGYSHALGKNNDPDYWGVDADSAILARFIRAYLTANNRWNSPKYLAGESYGTIRASVLIRDLELKPLDGVFFNGVILLSAALDVRTFLGGGPGNELPYVTDLPTFAATAYYHRALPSPPNDLESFISKVQEFASSEYLVALFKGDSLTADEEREIAEKLHQFTGLGTEYLKRSRLRIDKSRFLKELLRGRGQTIAMHDTRFLGKDPNDAGEAVELDPFLIGMTGPFVTAINSYLSADLNVKIKEPYIVFSLAAASGWKRAGDGNNVFAGFLNTSSYLAAAAATNKDFRVFVASGTHDLTTTFYGTQYVFAHSGIDKSRLTMKTYDGGHMMYLYVPSLQRLSEDIGAFLKSK